MGDNDLECDCCGNIGAVADEDGFFFDGQGTVCECEGLWVSLDSESPPYISGECEVDHD